MLIFREMRAPIYLICFRYVGAWIMLFLEIPLCTDFGLVQLDFRMQVHTGVHAVYQ